MPRLNSRASPTHTAVHLAASRIDTACARRWNTPRSSASSPRMAALKRTHASGEPKQPPRYSAHERRAISPPPFLQYRGDARAHTIGVFGGVVREHVEDDVASLCEGDSSCVRLLLVRI